MGSEYPSILGLVWKPSETIKASRGSLGVCKQQHLIPWLDLHNLAILFAMSTTYSANINASRRMSRSLPSRYPQPRDGHVKKEAQKNAVLQGVSLVGHQELSAYWRLGLKQEKLAH